MFIAYLGWLIGIEVVVNIKILITFRLFILNIATIAQTGQVLWQMGPTYLIQILYGSILRLHCKCLKLRGHYLWRQKFDLLVYLLPVEWLVRYTIILDFELVLTVTTLNIHVAVPLWVHFQIADRSQWLSYRAHLLFAKSDAWKSEIL